MGWLYNELQDLDTAIEWNIRSIQYSQKFMEVEPEANSQVNLGQNYINIGDLDRAFNHLQNAQNLYKQDVWLRWRYNIRLQAELARYWMAKGDLKLALEHASHSLREAKRTISRKYIVYANKLLGDIAILEDRIEDAQKYFDDAFQLLREYSCPFVEWKLLNSSIELAKKLRVDDKRDELIAKKQKVIKSIADSISEERLRKIFLYSKSVREP